MGGESRQITFHCQRRRIRRHDKFNQGGTAAGLAVGPRLLIGRAEQAVADDDDDDAL